LRLRAKVTVVGIYKLLTIIIAIVMPLHLFKVTYFGIKESCRNFEYDVFCDEFCGFPAQ